MPRNPGLSYGKVYSIRFKKQKKPGMSRRKGIFGSALKIINCSNSAIARQKNSGR